MTETLELVGTPGAITEKPSGWTEVEVQVEGKQYPVKLTTKRAALADAARGLFGSPATFTYVEREGSTNPNTGKPYINRYLESVVRLDAGSATPAPPAAPAPQQAPAPGPVHAAVHFADKDRAISRMACLKAASVAMQGRLPAEPTDADITHVLRVAARFEQWIYRDLDPLPFA